MNPSEILAQQHKFEIQQLQDRFRVQMTRELQTCIEAANKFYRMRAAASFEAIRRNIERAKQERMEGTEVDLDALIEACNQNQEYFESEALTMKVEGHGPPKKEIIV